MVAFKRSCIHVGVKHKGKRERERERERERAGEGGRGREREKEREREREREREYKFYMLMGLCQQLFYFWSLLLYIYTPSTMLPYSYSSRPYSPVYCLLHMLLYM